MLRSLGSPIRRFGQKSTAVGAPVVALAAALSLGTRDALATLPPDVSPPPVVFLHVGGDPYVVIMSDVDAPSSPARDEIPRARGGSASARRPTRACTLVRVTVVNPDGRVETRVVSQRPRQRASTD
jgi:hypothetical protein